MATFNNGESGSSVRTKINEAIDKVDGNSAFDNDIEVNGNISLGDNDELRFGDGNDLILEHNGSNGDIRNNINDLLIRNLADDRDVRIIADDGSGGTADYFRADGSTGEAQLFYYGAEKLNTTSTGVDVTGNVSLRDNDELRFGDSDDLKITHNSTFSDIRNNTGLLAIRNAADNEDVVIQTDNGSGSLTDYFRADGSTGEAILYYYGSEKLNTTSTGVNVTGALTLSAADPFIKLTDTSTGVDHEIDANSGVGNMVIHTDINSEGSDPKLLLKVSGTTGITVRDTGNVDISGTLTPDALEVFTNNDSPQGNVKLGRASTQYIDFHGGSSANFMSSISPSANPKPLKIKVTAGAAAYDYNFTHAGVFTCASLVETSDERVKSNIVDAVSQWDDVSALRLCNYTMNETNERHLGVVAQEAQQVSPGLVKDISSDGDGSLLGVNKSALTMKMFGALQEAMQRIEELESKINMLINSTEDDNA